MVSQHWLRRWLGAIRQQAIFWTIADQDLRNHMTSQGINELKFALSYVRYFIFNSIAILTKHISFFYFWNISYSVRYTYDNDHDIFLLNIFTASPNLTFIFSGETSISKTKDKMFILSFFLWSEIRYKKIVDNILTPVPRPHVYTGCMLMLLIFIWLYWKLASNFVQKIALMKPDRCGIWYNQQLDYIFSIVSKLMETKISELHIIGPLWWESIGDRRIRRTKYQKCEYVSLAWRHREQEINNTEIHTHICVYNVHKNKMFVILFVHISF